MRSFTKSQLAKLTKSDEYQNWKGKKLQTETERAQQTCATVANLNVLAYVLFAVVTLFAADRFAIGGETKLRSLLGHILLAQSVACCDLPVHATLMAVAYFALSLSLGLPLDTGFHVLIGLMFAKVHFAHFAGLIPKSYFPKLLFDLYEQARYEDLNDGAL